MAQVSYYQFKEKAKSKTWQNMSTCIISNLSLLNRNWTISFVIKKPLNMSKLYMNIQEKQTKNTPVVAYQYRSIVYNFYLNKKYLKSF